MTPLVQPTPTSSRPAVAPPPPLTESVGLRLRRARIQRGLSLQGVARTTRISVSQLESLEQDRFEDLPGDVYARGFVRSVAHAVGLDSNVAMAHYSSDRRSRTTTLHPARFLPEKKPARLGVLVACSVFLLLLVVATLAATHPRQKSTNRVLSAASTPSSSIG